MATQSTTFGRFTVPPLIWGVLGLFALEVLLKNTLLRKIP